MRIIPVGPTGLLLFALGGLTAAEVPCTQNGFYYAVCPVQPRVGEQRLVDGSTLPQPPPTDSRAFDGSKLSPLPPHLHSLAADPKTRSDHKPAPAAAPLASVLQKNWRNYTIAEWMSIGSIFLLTLIVGVVFYLVNRTLQNERKITA